MISEIRQAFINKLVEFYPSGYVFYEDKVHQNFKTPSFLVSVYDHEYDKRLNTKYKSVISFDIAYFSDQNQADIISDCLVKEEVLLRGFDLFGTFRAINKKARTTDGVLHILFDVNYSEMKSETSIPMQAQTTNTKI